MHLMLDFSYNLDSVFSHELCKSAFSDGIFWDSGVEPQIEKKLNATVAKPQQRLVPALLRG
ncbi:hypothetical protein D5F51_22360 (plasmid) [Yersinia hibernica]|uniref:Uncharacterized protein n=1 Tax=Yersinia hibernica TaxID=2339259 RepID=A0ABX5R7L2_9GAMM|nr:hypothetical protein D5F51_22360 [Yersinia hibernica]